MDENYDENDETDINLPNEEMVEMEVETAEAEFRQQSHQRKIATIRNKNRELITWFRMEKEKGGTATLEEEGRHQTSHEDWTLSARLLCLGLLLEFTEVPFRDYEIWKDTLSKFENLHERTQESYLKGGTIFRTRDENLEEIVQEWSNITQSLKGRSNWMEFLRRRYRVRELKIRDQTPENEEANAILMTFHNDRRIITQTGEKYTTSEFYDLYNMVGTLEDKDRDELWPDEMEELREEWKKLNIDNENIGNELTTDGEELQYEIPEKEKWSELMRREDEAWKAIPGMHYKEATCQTTNKMTFVEYVFGQGSEAF